MTQTTQEFDLEGAISAAYTAHLEGIRKREEEEKQREQERLQQEIDAFRAKLDEVFLKQFSRL